MKIIDYIQQNASQFTIYALLDMFEFYYELPLDDIPGLRIENNQTFLTQEFNEIHSIQVSSTNIVLKINSPNFLHYIPTNYIDSILEANPDSSFKSLLFNFFSIWTHRFVIIGYRVRNMQYLPKYPKQLQHNMYDTLMDIVNIRDMLMLITKHKTAYCLERVLSKAFFGQAAIKIEKLMPRKVATNFHSRNLGQIVLGKSSYLLDKVIIKIICYKNELFFHLKANPEFMTFGSADPKIVIEVTLADHLFLKGKLGEIRLNWNSII